MQNVLGASYLYSNYLEQLPSLDFLYEFDPGSGAAGINRDWTRTGKGTVNARAQEIGELLICKALATDNAGDLESGLKVLSFGFDLQHRDGSFPQYAADEHSHCATSFYLCAALLSLLMLRDAKTHEYEQVYEKWRPHITGGVKYITEQKPEHPELANHLCVNAAAALLVSVIYPGVDITEKACHLSEAVISVQNVDGSWPERGGVDTLYQAISLIYGTYALLACADENMRVGLRNALDKGFDWLARQIMNNGSIDCSKNTRKTLDKVPPDNEAVYTGDFINIDYAFRMWGDITGETRYAALADSIRGWVRQSCPGANGSSWDEKLTGIA